MGRAGQALGDLRFQVFGLLSHSTCWPTAMLLLLLPQCPRAQLSHSRDLPPPQACCWGHLVGLGGGQGQGRSDPGDEPGATSSLWHPEMGALTAGLLGRSEWHHLLPSSCVSSGTSCPRIWALVGGFHWLVGPKWPGVSEHWWRLRYFGVAAPAGASILQTALQSLFFPLAPPWGALAPSWHGTAHFGEVELRGT